MKYIGLECATITELKECGSNKLTSMGLDVDKVEKKFTDSFLGDGDNIYLR